MTHSVYTCSYSWAQKGPLPSYPWERVEQIQWMWSVTQLEVTTRWTSCYLHEFIGESKLNYTFNLLDSHESINAGHMNQLLSINLKVYWYGAWCIRRCVGISRITNWIICYTQKCQLCLPYRECNIANTWLSYQYCCSLLQKKFPHCVQQSPHYSDSYNCHPHWRR